MQDPEGILSAPQGGHISRRSLSKEVERNKELQAEVDRLKKEKSEELQQQRDVCHFSGRSSRPVRAFAHL